MREPKVELEGNTANTRNSMNDMNSKVLNAFEILMTSDTFKRTPRKKIMKAGKSSAWTSERKKKKKEKD